MVTVCVDDTVLEMETDVSGGSFLTISSLSWSMTASSSLKDAD
jgi:hypothetical protein